MFPFLQCLAVQRQTEIVHKHSPLGSMLGECFPSHPICKSQSEKALLLIYIPPFQFAQLNCTTRSSHRQLDHSIDGRICSSIVKHVCLHHAAPYALSAVITISVSCEQVWASSPCVGVVLSFNEMPTKTTARRDWSELVGEAG